jgi:serine/threonine protein kinase
MSETLRPSSLLQRVFADQRERWRHGERVFVEFYLQEHPELFTAESQVELIYAEYCLREDLGEVPDPRQYVNRFPEHASALRALFDDHQAMKPSPASVDGIAAGPTQLQSERAAGDTTVTGALRQQRFVAQSDRPSLTGRRLGDYEVQAELGRGGMGIVYRAYDHRQGRIVALKILPQASNPSLIYRFKREFRALVDLAHSNLVSLYEMVFDGEHWFFTMELVDGVNFRAYVRGSSQQSAGAPHLSVDQADRLRHAIDQLAHGLQALHANGKLHRDIKPSNVLVDRSGRVVILDFGLAADLDSEGLHRPSQETAVVGTYDYMAPEQLRGEPVSAATDWYSVGVMLYETLTGQRPFRRPIAQMLQDTQIDFPRASEVASGVPEELDQLCQDLLNRRPEERPGVEAILARIKGSSQPRNAAVAPSETRRSSVSLFVGRDQQLDTLRQAFKQTQARHPISIFVDGESGVGKSALIERFLSELKDDPSVVVLQGRCYERESVPYKALDSVVDALSRFLCALPATELPAILPRNPAAVCQLFPVLGRIALITNEVNRAPHSSDRQELRRQGIEGLRELFGRLGDRKRLVVYIDDLQWGDVDSALLIRRILGPPDPPVMLLIGCYRTADRARSDCLKSLLGSTESSSSFSGRQELTIERLGEDEIRNLVTAIYQGNEQAAEQTAAIVVRDSRGSPYFAAELTRFAREQSIEFFSSADTLDNLLWRRAERLPRDARLLMETVAVAGLPLFVADAWHASALSPESQPALDLLCNQRLVRTSGSAASQTVETYHDRVRETVVSHLAADRRRELHASLAATLEASNRTDSEVIGNHFREAGNPSAAAKHYADAAANAMAALAFERAVGLYKQSIDCLSQGDESLRTLRIGLAEALANAGRGRDAASHYIAAADMTIGPAANEFRRRAAEQLLISGHTDEGLAIFRQMLRTVGVKLPPKSTAAIFGLLIGRIRDRLHRIGRPLRRVGAENNRITEQIDAYWAASVGLALVDPVRAILSNAKGLRLALRSGDRFRIGRALSFDALSYLAGSERHDRRANALLAVAETIASETDSPYLRSFNFFVRGFALDMRGSWKEGSGFMQQALAIQDQHGMPDVWLQTTIRRVSLWAVAHCGNLAQLSKELPGLLDDAERRGNVYLQTGFGTFARTFLQLANDEPLRARSDLHRVLKLCSTDEIRLEHFMVLYDEAQIDLYEEKIGAAWDRLQRGRATAKGSRLLRFQKARVFWNDVRGRVAVALAQHSPSNALRKEAYKAAQSLDKEALPWARACAEVIHSGLCRASGEVPRARAHLLTAQNLFSELGMQLHGVAVRRCLAAISDASTIEAHIQEIDQMFVDKGVRNPSRFSKLLVPGF